VEGHTGKSNRSRREKGKGSTGLPKEDCSKADLPVVGEEAASWQKDSKDRSANYILESS
jgi:hypothetical protein